MSNLLASSDLNEAARLIEKLVPGFRVDAIKLDHQGMDNFTFRVNSDWIFRFPKVEEYRFQVERWALQRLQGKTTLKLPQIEFYGEDPPFVAYRAIEGTKLAEIWPTASAGQKESIAHQLAQFLSEIHKEIDPAEALQNGFVQDEGWHEALSKAAIKHREIGTGTPWFELGVESMERLGGYLSDPVATRFVHQDLHGDNIIANPDGQIVGVIDFGDCSVGDLHAELYATCWLSLDATLLVASAYKKHTGFPVDIQRVADYYIVELMANLSRADRFDRCFQCLNEAQSLAQSGFWNKDL